MMFYNYMTFFILTILSGIIFYGIYILSTPDKNTTKLTIDFKRAYDGLGFKARKIGYRILLDLPKNIKSRENKHCQTKTYLSAEGYRRFKGSHILVHRWIMEKSLNRKLLPAEVVHHRDGNRLNNQINNLRLFPDQKMHDLYHREHLKNYGTWHEEIPEYANYKKYPEYAKQF